MKTKSALSYFGSDSEVAHYLAEYLNRCKHVTIPFCGGLSVLPNLTARTIVANDLHNQVINFYRHASGRYGKSAQDELIQKCQSTLSHPDEIRLAQLYCDEEELKDSLNQAWAFWALCWIGRKGKGGTKSQGGQPSVRRTANGGNNASRIKAAANDLDDWAKQFERCEWESVDYRILIPKVADKPECGIYCDPPWVDAGHNYLHPFTEQDHIDLAGLLHRFQHTTVLVRYGDHPIIRNLYPGWRIAECTSRDQHNASKQEIWITREQTAH